MVWLVLVIFCPVFSGFLSCQRKEVLYICGGEEGESEKGGETGKDLFWPQHRIRTYKLLDLETIELCRFCQFR